MSGGGWAVPDGDSRRERDRDSSPPSAPSPVCLQPAKPAKKVVKKPAAKKPAAKVRRQGSSGERQARRRVASRRLAGGAPRQQMRHVASSSCALPARAAHSSAVRQRHSTMHACTCTACRGTLLLTPLPTPSLIPSLPFCCRSPLPRPPSPRRTARRRRRRPPPSPRPPPPSPRPRPPPRCERVVLGWTRAVGSHVVSYCACCILVHACCNPCSASTPNLLLRA